MADFPLWPIKEQHSQKDLGARPCFLCLREMKQPASSPRNKRSWAEQWFSVRSRRAGVRGLELTKVRNWEPKRSIFETSVYLNSSAMLTIAIITWISRAVKHSIRGLAGRYAPRPAATRCLGLAQLIRSLPGGIVLPSCQIHSASSAQLLS